MHRGPGVLISSHNWCKDLSHIGFTFPVNRTTNCTTTIKVVFGLTRTTKNTVFGQATDHWFMVYCCCIPSSVKVTRWLR